MAKLPETQRSRATLLPSCITRTSVWGIAILAAAAACNATRLDDRLTDLMVGVSTRDVYKVYGSPAKVTREGPVEVLVYEWSIPNVDSIVERRNNSHIPSREKFQVDADCVVTVESRRGVVTAVAAEGRTTSNGIYTAGCTRVFLSAAERR